MVRGEWPCCDLLHVFSLTVAISLATRRWTPCRHEAAAARVGLIATASHLFPKRQSVRERQSCRKA